MLASDVSQAYFELLGLRLQLDIARETIQSYTATLKLFNDRLQEGLGNALQTSRASADLEVAAASARDLERQIALKENQISVLMGKNPGAIETKLKLLEETVPPTIPAGLPSALLERRPDVLAAAQRVRYANAQIGVAKSAYFPRIGLTTFFGKLSTPLADLTSGNTNAWSLGANVSGPIFRGGAIKAQNRQAAAYWEEARVQYLQTALSAFRDVADALVSREKFDNIREDLIRGVQSSEEAVRLARMRYVEGLSSYNEVLEAQQRLYPAQLALAQTEINRRLVVVQLYKALGGGWNLTDAQWMAANSPPGAHSSSAGQETIASDEAYGRPTNRVTQHQRAVLLGCDRSADYPHRSDRRIRLSVWLRRRRWSDAGRVDPQRNGHFLHHSQERALLGIHR